jgi:hypothetical protein
MKEIVLTSPDQPCFIGAWYLPDVTVCDRIMESFNSNKVKKTEGTLGSGSRLRVDKARKNSMDGDLSADPDVASDYVSNLQSVLEAYSAKFTWADEVDFYKIFHLQVQKYPKNGGYPAWHSERMANNRRHLTYMTYLNDIEDGGETEFLYQKIKVKPRKGLTLIWPVDWTHTHRGIVSPSQEKTIITGWYEFFEEEIIAEQLPSLVKTKSVAA